MSNRKQTPDVLSEILGGEPVAAQLAPTPKPPVPPKRSPSPRKRSKPKPPVWEYLEVVFRDYGGYRPRYVNGEEQKDWKQAPVIREYLNQLGEEGWELVGLGTRHKNEMPAFFKRPKS